MERRRCTYCGKTMLMVTTVAGASMPLDPDPVPTGNVVLESARSLESQVEVGAKRARVLKRDEFVAPGVERYSTHFATCEKHPRRRNKDAPQRGRSEPYGEERDIT